MSESPHRRPPLPLPKTPPPGPFRQDSWKSPLRGPWLASFLASLLLPLIVVCALTGFLSHWAYDPDLGRNSSIGRPSGPWDLYFGSWPSGPAYLYVVTQGLHVISGLAALPILFAKLWAVIPQLFEWPPVRSLAHGLERLGLALLVGGSLFVFFTGIMNIQIYYPWSGRFSFIPAHYYGAFLFLAALGLHVALKLPIARRAFRERGVVGPLRESRAQTTVEPPAPGERPGEWGGSSAPSAPAEPTISRRGLVGLVAGSSVGLAIMGIGQVVGGPLRPLSLLGPRRQNIDDGPNGFQVNKTARRAGITPEKTGASWRLELTGPREVALSRDELLAMPQHTETLPIACVEGWSTTQEWTGVRLRDLAAMAGVEGEPGTLRVQSIQGGTLGTVVLNPGIVQNPRSLLALRVNGADLSPDHGFPARVIAPAIPGVHCTKWVAQLTFQA